ncbi:hypothetical protein U1872_12825 [Sphingomonas sp. RB3P16]|uniref:hypothetical protein n=1 Tax=Parasphingomonas frigoris TaxID=3096163 RepID=UPI002FCB8E6F
MVHAMLRGVDRLASVPGSYGAEVCPTPVLDRVVNIRGRGRLRLRASDRTSMRRRPRDRVAVIRMKATICTMENTAACFLQSYINALNATFEELITDEGVVVTNIILGKAFEVYRGISSPDANIYGHACKY